MNSNQIQYVLMMPEDLLTARLPSKIFLDCLKRLLMIEQFLDYKIENPSPPKLTALAKKTIGEKRYRWMTTNKEFSPQELGHIRILFKQKINRIRTEIKCQTI